MEVCNLMIGDLVQFDEDTCVIEELRVDGTAVLVAMNTDLTSVDGDQVDVEELYPIPLTEDILVKNGFQKLNDKTFLLKNQIEIEVGPKFSEVSARYEDYDRDYNSYSNRYIEIAIIHYVHELQHLLRLMGVEKEIEL